MFTKILVTIIVLFSMALTIFLAPAPLKAQETQQEFNAQTIATDISKKVGNFDFTTDPQCSLITDKLKKIYKTILCQLNDHESEKAQLLIDNIMNNYQIEAINDWTKQGNYTTRIYVSTELEEAPTINLVISDKIIFVGY